MPNPVRPNPAPSDGLPIPTGPLRTRATVVALVAVLSGLPAGTGAETTPPAPARGWADTLLAPFDDLSHWISGLFSHEDGLVADEIGQFKHTVDSDLSAFEALVRQAGFTLASVSVGARLEPQLSVTMAFERRLSEREKAALMTRITDPAHAVGTVERSIIMTLLNAAESAYAVRNDGFRLSQVSIDLDTLPKVTMTMAPVSHWP